MAKTTAYMVQGFETTAKNRLRAKPPMKASSREHADRLAERLAQKGGAIAVAQTADPEMGEYGEPELIARYGQVPAGLLDALN